MYSARTSKAAARLSAQFRDRSVCKEYLAIVHGQPTPNTQTLSGEYEGKPERLSFESLESDARQTLLLVRPASGRKHQIRRQLSGIGHPILGDLRYGAAGPLPARRIALFPYGLCYI